MMENFQVQQAPAVMLKETFKHLKENRFEIALINAKKLFEINPNDPEILCALAWASLENHFPKEALEYANLAVKIGNNRVDTHLYRGFILMRLGIYESSFNDLDIAGKSREVFVPWSLELKAKALASVGRYQEAYKTFENACRLDKEILKEYPMLRDWYKDAAGLKNTFLSKLITQDKPLIEQAEYALNIKEYWFASWAVKKLLKTSKNSDEISRTKLIEFETLFELFQYKSALAKAEEIKKDFSNDARFQEIYKKILEINSRQINSNQEESINPNVATPIKLKDENLISDSSELEDLSENDKNSGLSRLKAPSQKERQEFRDKEEDKIEFLEPTHIMEVKDSPASLAKAPTERPSFKKFDLINQMNEEDIVEHKSIREKENNFKKPITINKRTDFLSINNPLFKVYNARVYDVVQNMNANQKSYMLQFSEQSIRYIGLEVIMSNPYYMTQSVAISGKMVWLHNENIFGEYPFELNIDQAWKHIVFFQSWGTENTGYWQRGQGRAEVFINNSKICEKWFLVGSSIIYDYEDFDITDIDDPLPPNIPNTNTLPSSIAPKSNQNPLSLDESLKELDAFVGLTSVKKSMRDFIDYLTFIKERKKLGLKTKDGISVNSVFLGNPGTGKTSVARILGNIFKEMGILTKGHLVETDRGGLVGQYIGETAQKTEAITTEALGGLLFVDEAYTLVKKSGSGQDFGQEAIDTLMKRMEDKAGEFVVIVAGYPDEMKSFLESNPGMKSRFTHFFDFEDYTPDELIAIFKGMSKKEDYNLTPESSDQLKKEFIELYRKRDKTFGNARLVRNVFEDSKMQLSKRYLKLPEKLRDQKALTTFIPQDIIEIFKKGDLKNYKVGIDEENLKIALDKLNGLLGLDSVKKEINELVKLARFYAESGDNIQKKFSDHIVFLGSPGTGKTTVARLFSSIYASLGILPKGHLIETDRQNLVASYVGKTAEKTAEVIDSSMGGTLFVDEAYSLVKSGDSGSDFGKEAIDTLLKRMEDDRGKFIVIAAGYTEEMKGFLDSNPGLQSRFTKFITFEDYTPDEMMQIAQKLFAGKSLKMDANSAERLKIYFNDIYRGRDKTFSNARFVRNIVDSAARNQLLRIVDLPKEERSDDLAHTVNVDDFIELRKKVSDKPQVIVGNKELLEKYLAELDQLVGLDAVKRSVDKLVSSLKIAKLRQARGLTVIQKSLHGVFLGNPGTGKTTIARLISQIYKEMGLLEKGHLVEVDRSSLVAGYQGQTTKKTDDVIQSALGGTLFIDEAYTLSRGAGDFGQEAIDTILKRMEDYRDQLVVIVAGYPNEMRQFLDSNPGLQSRFTNFFFFEDYDPSQMMEIADLIIQKNGYKVDKEARELLLQYFSNLYDNRDDNFGNARTVRNILYRAISNQEERILTIDSLSDEDLVKITSEDIVKLDF